MIKASRFSVNNIGSIYFVSHGTKHRTLMCLSGNRVGINNSCNFYLGRLLENRNCVPRDDKSIIQIQPSGRKQGDG